MGRRTVDSMRNAALKSAPWVEEAFITSVRRKSEANREAILREMESLAGDEQQEYVLRTFAGFRSGLR